MFRWKIYPSCSLLSSSVTTPTTTISKCCLLTLSSHSSALQLSAPLWICGIFEPLKGHILSFPLSSFFSTSYWILRVVTHYIFKHQRVSFVFYLLCHSLTHTHTPRDAATFRSPSQVVRRLLRDSTELFQHREMLQTRTQCDDKKKKKLIEVRHQQLED